jgi:catechol 2,3-dioxygenase-like lactoylglutathione lyase family enzyme
LPKNSRSDNKYLKNSKGKTSFTGLTLLVRNVPRSIEYYSKIPGARILVATPEFAMLQIGNKESRLGLLKSRRGKGFHLEFETRDLDTVYSIMSRSGKVRPPAKRSWGERSFTMKDPDGYHVEFEDGGRSNS